MRTEGFRASLAFRGHSLRVLPGTQTLSALLNPKQLTPDRFQLSQEERAMTEVHILRSDIITAEVTITPQNTFKDLGNNDTYRISKVIDVPVNIAVIFECEVVNRP